jgi:hypothetical protein
MKANELITIAPISNSSKETMENDEIDNQENTDDGAENTIRSKQLELELNLIVPYLDVFWEETGTDTIEIEHYPFQTIIRNVTVENQSGKVMNIPIYRLGTDYIIRNNQINIAETKTIPVVIDKDADNHNIIYSLNRMDRYGDSYFDKSNSKSLELKVRNKVKERAFTKHSQKWTTGEHIIFTLHTDSKILAVVQNLSNKTVERKLHCYDNSTGEFLWEFPKKDNQEYDLITKSLHLEDVSSEYNKVIVEFNNSEIEYRPDKKCIILNSESGIESWSLAGFDSLSVFGNTDKCLVSELDYPGLNCGLFECRDLNTGEIIWRECLGYNSFLRADNNNAYFRGDVNYIESQKAFSKNNPPKKVEYNTPYWLDEIFQILPKHDDPEKYINNWSEKMRNRFKLEIGSTEMLFFCRTLAYVYSNKTFYFENLIITVDFTCDGEYCEYAPSALHVHDAKTGQLIANLYGYPENGNINYKQEDYFHIDRMDYINVYYHPEKNYFNRENEILEVGGYFFKIPSGEHIDLPTLYRLQHYSETTGYYYFLDTEKGEIVCLRLP